MSATPDRARRPATGASRLTSPPVFERLELPEGLELYLAPRAAVPLVELELLLTDAGGEKNPSDRPGLARLAAALLDEGTMRRSGPELVADLERRGGSLGSSSDWSSGSLRLSLPSAELEFGLELLRELILEPSFPPRELERIRRQSLAELARRFEQPAVLAEEAFAKRLYEGTVQGELLIGTPSSLTDLTRDEIVSFHARHQKRIGARLVLAGDLPPRGQGRGVERLLGELAFSRPARPVAVSPVALEHVAVVVVDLPEAAQTELRVGHLGVPRRHPDRTALGFLNALFGGKFTSRINLNLRERLGITYGIHSRFVDRRSAGPFVIAGAIANHAVGLAVREILDELRRLRDERVSSSELEETRSYLLGVFPYGLQTVEGIAAKLRDIALHELPLDHATRVLEEYQEISADELLRVARQHLSTDRCVIVAAGPGDDLARQLDGIGALEVRTPRPDGERNRKGLKVFA